MSTMKPSNPKAFPCGNDSHVLQSGMTLRDYFAAKAMEGLISNFKGDVSTSYEIITTVSYKMADVMLKEREK